MPIKLLLGLAIGAAARFASPQLSGQAEPVSPVVAHSADHLEMQPSPINPEWILSGSPVARCAEHSRTADDLSWTAVWDCTAGEFHWHFHWDETVVILEGDVHIEAADGTRRTLHAGDVALFRAGTSATWRVEHYVRKIAFLRRPFPGPLAALIRLRNRLRGLSARNL